MTLRTTLANILGPLLPKSGAAAASKPWYATLLLQTQQLTKISFHVVTHLILLGSGRIYIPKLYLNTYMYR